MVVVAQILVAQRDAEHPLPDQRCHLMFDQLRRAGIGKAGGEPVDQPDRPLARTQQQRPGIRGHRPASKIGCHATPFHGCKKHQSSGYTLSASGLLLQPR